MISYLSRSLLSRAERDQTTYSSNSSTAGASMGSAEGETGGSVLTNFTATNSDSYSSSNNTGYFTSNSQAGGVTSSSSTDDHGGTYGITNTGSQAFYSSAPGTVYNTTNSYSTTYSGTQTWVTTTTTDAVSTTSIMTRFSQTTTVAGTTTIYYPIPTFDAWGPAGLRLGLAGSSYTKTYALGSGGNVTFTGTTTTRVTNTVTDLGGIYVFNTVFLLFDFNGLSANEILWVVNNTTATSSGQLSDVADSYAVTGHTEWASDWRSSTTYNATTSSTTFSQTTITGEFSSPDITFTDTFVVGGVSLTIVDTRRQFHLGTNTVPTTSFDLEGDISYSTSTFIEAGDSYTFEDIFFIASSYTFTASIPTTVFSIATLYASTGARYLVDNLLNFEDSPDYVDLPTRTVTFGAFSASSTTSSGWREEAVYFWEVGPNIAAEQQVTRWGNRNPYPWLASTTLIRNTYAVPHNAVGFEELGMAGQRAALYQAFGATMGAGLNGFTFNWIQDNVSRDFRRGFGSITRQQLAARDSIWALFSRTDSFWMEVENSAYDWVIATASFVSTASTGGTLACKVSRVLYDPFNGFPTSTVSLVSGTIQFGLGSFQDRTDSTGQSTVPTYDTARGGMQKCTDARETRWSPRNKVRFTRLVGDLSTASTSGHTDYGESTVLSTNELIIESVKRDWSLVLNVGDISFLTTPRYASIPCGFASTMMDYYGASDTV